MRCEMIRVVLGEERPVELPPCGKPRRRETCCDECFETLVAQGEMSRTEAEQEYPLIRTPPP